MKKYVNLVRLGVGLAAWGLALLVVFYPAGMAKRGWMAVTRVDMAERRRRNATHLAEAGASLRFLARLFIGLDIEAHVRTNIHGLERPASFILAGNHRHAMDATNYTVATKKIRQMSIRYVVKWAIVKIWFLGKLFRENGYAIVARKKDRPDLSSAERRELNRPVLEEYYRLAREDEAGRGDEEARDDKCPDALGEGNARSGGDEGGPRGGPGEDNRDFCTPGQEGRAQRLAEADSQKPAGGLRRGGPECRCGGQEDRNRRGIADKGCNGCRRDD